MGESLSKGAVAHACIFINCFGVAASKKLEEGTLGQRDPKQAKTAGKFKGFFASMAALREAGSAWSEQGCSTWCAEPALPLLTACAAAAVLTVVFARAEFFTLAIAGLILRLSGNRSSSTSRSPSCCRMAELISFASNGRRRRGAAWSRGCSSRMPVRVGIAWRLAAAWDAAFQRAWTRAPIAPLRVA